MDEERGRRLSRDLFLVAEQLDQLVGRLGAQEIALEPSWPPGPMVMTG